ncbi:MAG TPA: hypothetical protein VE715_21040 [Blastocatellia bacterium]|nr:hypothetical protein [Blastocatellia bacterium]
MEMRYDKEAERIAELARSQTPEGQQAYTEYCNLLERAVREGQIGRSDRILQLYPIVREINDEIDEAIEESKVMEPIYAAADKIVDAFADIIDLRDAMPADFHAQICRLLVGWVGEVDFRLSGEELKEHSLRPTLGDAVCDELVKRLPPRPKAA